ncbi:MAG: hypothetical protein ACWGQW_01585 [bacterium]
MTTIAILVILVCAGLGVGGRYVRKRRRMLSPMLRHALCMIEASPVQKLSTHKYNNNNTKYYRLDMGHGVVVEDAPSECLNAVDVIIDGEPLPGLTKADRRAIREVFKAKSLEAVGDRLLDVPLLPETTNNEE